MSGKIVLDSLMEPKLVLGMLPPPVECQDGTIYGNYSLMFPKGVERPDGIVTRRAVLSRAVRGLPNTQIFDTETAFTRCWLRSLGPRKARKNQGEGFLKSRPPQYIRPSESNCESFYVDIAAAYHSVYSRLSWRVEYLRGRYFSNNSDKLVYPFPLEWKTGRSYVVTAALPAQKRIVFGGKVSVYDTHNPYFNSPFVAAVWDVLSAVARFAVDVFHARYFNLDGAIVAEKDLYGYCEFLQSLRLPYKIKHQGFARVLNLGCWRIGDYSTARYEQDSIVRARDEIPVTLEEAGWILARFERM